jgi:uncharacterized RDD family membrane protein YckC
MISDQLATQRAGSLLERTGAYLLDSLATAIAWGAILVAITGGEPLSATEGGVDAVLAGFLFLLVPFAYFVGFEAITRTTPGKRVFGLRVVDEHGAPVAAFEAVVRNVLRLAWALNPIGPAFLALDAVLVQVTRDDQRVGDLAAGTRVVRTDRSVLDRVG